MNDFYLNKDTAYFINPRLDLVSLIPIDQNQRVLEIGMGGGDTLIYIKKQKLASEVVGIDLMELPGTNQQSPFIDKTYFFDLETKDLPFLNDYFDVIIAGDVLEHLIDPWNVLEKLSKVLKPGGCILTSIPNFRDIVALNAILFKGNFNYSSQGIFDKTHLRFFCKKDMIKLIESAEKLKIEKIIPIQNLDKKNPKRELFNRLTLNIFEQFVTPQYLFKIIKTN